MIEKIAKMLGANQNQVSDVFNKAKGIPQTKEAFIDLINKNGGIAQLKKAEQLLNNPFADKILGGFGFDAKEIKKAVKEVKNGVGTQSSNKNDFLNRLNNMK